MPRFHIGLKANSPVQAIELGGHSFQKESWVHDQDGSHTSQPGIKFTIEDEKASKAFEAKWKKDAEKFVFRTTVTKSGVRSEVVDVTIPGEFPNKKKDLPVAKFAYCLPIADEPDDLPSVEELLDDERSLVDSAGKAMREAKGKKAEISEKAE